MILPYDFDLLHIFAVLWIFIMWGLYAPVLRFFGHGTLNTQLHVVRLKWMRMLLHSKRESRVFDERAKHDVEDVRVVELNRRDIDGDLDAGRP